MSYVLKGTTMSSLDYKKCQITISIQVVHERRVNYGNTGCGVFNGGYKLERFLPRNQHIQRKLLNFEFWINGELSKIGHHYSNKVIQKLILSKNVKNKKCEMNKKN